MSDKPAPPPLRDILDTIKRLTDQNPALLDQPLIIGRTPVLTRRMFVGQFSTELVHRLFDLPKEGFLNGFPAIQLTD